MKSYVLIIQFIISLTLSAQENVSVLLDKYIHAIGGQGSINQVQNIYSLANCTGPNGTYQTEIQSATGNKTVFRQIRANKPDYIGIVNGDHFWTAGIEETIADKNSAYAWRSHELQWIATHLTDRFQQLKFAGTEEFAGKAAVKLSAIDELNKTAYLYFDKNTSLLLGLVIFSPFGESPETIRLTINNWKIVGKIVLPSTATFSDKQGDFVLNFHTIKINQADPAVFNIPKRIMAIKEITALHELQRTAHFNRDARLLVSVMADDYIEVSNGRILTPSKEELIKRFQGYFDTVTFIEWDDIQPPIIKISDDGMLAYVIVSKRVQLINQQNEVEITVFAWTNTYQNINDNWLMTSTTSTVAR